MATDQVLPADLAIAELKSPNTDTLAKPPLELVVCQVRHEPVPSVAEADRVPLVQEQLSKWCDRVEPVSSLPPGLPPGVVAASASTPSGWRFLSERGWIVTLNTDSFAVECTRYATWTAFNELLSSVITTVSSTYGPKLTQRVGLRFIDRFSRAESALPAQWIGWLDPAVLGFGAHPTLGGATLVAQTSSELVVEGLRANIRGSIATDNTPNGYSFVLDTDCFDDRVRRFDVEDVSAVIKRLHDLNLRLFQTVITDELYAEIHG
ncbi:MAG: TIGR04255 family protein [Propionicimonas sp.]